MPISLWLVFVARFPVSSSLCLPSFVLANDPLRAGFIPGSVKQSSGSALPWELPGSASVFLVPALHPGRYCLRQTLYSRGLHFHPRSVLWWLPPEKMHGLLWLPRETGGVALGYLGVRSIVAKNGCCSVPQGTDTLVWFPLIQLSCSHSHATESALTSCSRGPVHIPQEIMQESGLLGDRPPDLRVRVEGSARSSELQVENIYSFMPGRRTLWHPSRGGRSSF